jgi:UDP-N-acetylglucosamine 4-epimerase
VFYRTYSLETVGLRYFNVFGPRQDPNGAYAAVIPRWILAMLNNAPAYINGDGSTSRDFCYVANAVQANLLAATTKHQDAPGAVFNVAVNAQTSLAELFELLRRKLLPGLPHLQNCQPLHREFRAGDIRHSQAAIGAAQKVLGYAPTHRLEQGLDITVEWYLRHGNGASELAAA